MSSSEHTEKLNARVNKLVSASDPEEVKEIYQDWSHSYNADLKAFGYTAPLIGTRLLASKVSNKLASIHDAGCGTGIVGTLLHEHGFHHIHGTDFSQGMLDKAAETKHYESLNIADFGAPLEIDDNRFDATISIGVYTKRFKEHFIKDIVRTTKPGGCLVLTCRELYFSEVMNSVSSLMESNQIANVEFTYQEYMTGQSASAYYIAMTKSV